jgi:hypothetical protein
VADIEYERGEGRELPPEELRRCAPRAVVAMLKVEVAR